VETHCVLVGAISHAKFCLRLVDCLLGTNSLLVKGATPEQLDKKIAGSESSRKEKNFERRLRIGSEIARQALVDFRGTGTTVTHRAVALFSARVARPLADVLNRCIVYVVTPDAQLI